MLFRHQEIVENFEYNTEIDCWVRKTDGKQFLLLEKDKNDLVQAVELNGDLQTQSSSK